MPECYILKNFQDNCQIYRASFSEKNDMLWKLAWFWISKIKNLTLVAPYDWQINICYSVGILLKIKDARFPVKWEAAELSWWIQNILQYFIFYNFRLKPNPIGKVSSSLTDCLLGGNW